MEEIANSDTVASPQHQRRWSVPRTRLSTTHPTAILYNAWNGSLTTGTGKQKVMYALTKIKGVGRRYSNLVCKKADVDLNKRYAIIYHSAIVESRILTHKQRRRTYLRRARTSRHNHPEPNPIQNPRLVPQQTARYCGWKRLASPRQRCRLEAT